MLNLLNTNPYHRWRLWRRFWDRWGPWLALAVPVLVGVVTVRQLLLNGRG
jgi:hypothetical protein